MFPSTDVRQKYGEPRSNSTEACRERRNALLRESPCIETCTDRRPAGFAWANLRGRSIDSVEPRMLPTCFTWCTREFRTGGVPFYSDAGISYERSHCATKQRSTQSNFTWMARACVCEGALQQHHLASVHSAVHSA